MKSSLKQSTYAVSSILLAAAVYSQPSHADDLPQGGFAVQGGGSNHGAVRADGHAPIGAMGDHLHKRGEWMLSYRFMRMNMEGNRIGTDEVSPEEIVTTVPNLNPVVTPTGMTVVPPFLRVVPTKMTMDMHMFGGMYALTDNTTVMVMLPYIRKEMDHVTFQAPNPMKGIPPDNTDRIGGFTTKSENIGDLKLSALHRLYDDRINHVHLNLGISAPTGSIKKRDTILDPFGRTPDVRLPYSMQIGSGTWDLLPGITYHARVSDVSWGAQYMAEVRLES